MRQPSTFEQSFASHPRAANWSDKNADIKPEYVFRNSHKKYWFECKKCFDKSFASHH